MKLMSDHNNGKGQEVNDKRNINNDNNKRKIDEMEHPDQFPTTLHHNQKINEIHEKEGVFPLSSSTSSSSTSMKGLWNIFTQQKQSLDQLQLEIKYYQTDIQKDENKIQQLMEQNNTFQQLNEDLEEKIDIHEEMKEKLENELYELSSSKSNMMVTLEAINCKIDEVRDNSEKETLKFQEMSQKLRNSIQHVVNAQEKDRENVAKKMKRICGWRGFISQRRVSLQICRYNSLDSKVSSPESFNKIQQVTNTQDIQTYRDDNHGKLIKVNQPSRNVQDNVYYLMNFFLPKGYPTSIEKGYLNYASYQFCSYVFSTAGSVLSTQSLLYALGLGEGAIPLAATLNWIIKDGLGQFGGVLFASLVNNQFDQNPKRWRMISSIAMDASSFLELLTPLAPKSFLLLASFANIGKNISYLSASASRVAIHKSFTMHENLADLTAKTGSQTILSSLLGTSLGIYISTLVNHSYPYTMTAFISCSLLHLCFTHFSLQSVTIKTLSLPKFEKIFQHYFMNITAMTSHSSSSSQSTSPSCNILTSEQISSQESLLPSLSELSLLFTHRRHNPLSSSSSSSSSHSEKKSQIIIGADISEIFQSLADFQRAQEIFSSLPYLVVIKSPSHSSNLNQIFVLFYTDTTDEQALQAILLAHLIQQLLLTSHLPSSSFGPSLSGASSSSSPIHWDLMKDSLQSLQSNQFQTNEFLQQLFNQWTVDLFLLESKRSRLIRS